MAGVRKEPVAPDPRAPRPPWARRLDRWISRAARWADHLIGRPSEALLAELARPHRAAAAPAVQHRASPEAQIRAGRRALERGELAEALHAFSAALEQAPESPWAWHGRGDALQRLGDPAGALAAYQRAAALAPETGLHHAGASNALESLGRLGEAARAWDRALQLDPTLSWFREGRAPLPRIG